MKNKKISAILFCISAVLFYISAIMNFVCSEDATMGVMWLGLGSTFLCLGAMNVNQAKKEEENKEQKENEHESNII